MRRTVAIAAFVCALSGSAWALPHDARLTLAPGTDKILRAPIDVVDVASDPEGVVQVELLPSKEILVSVPAAAKGSATVFAIGDDRVYAWDVCLGKCPDETKIESAQAACPGLAQVNDDGKMIWKVTIKDLRCLDALKAALAHSSLTPNSLQLVIDEKPALDFFHRVQSAIAADPKTTGLTAGYYGPTLKLSGTVSRQAVAHAIVDAWRETVGAVSFDDQTSPPSGETQP